MGTCLAEATGKLSKREVTRAEFDFDDVNIAADRTTLAVMLQLIQYTSTDISSMFLGL